jgi:hypothetical protein
VRVVSGWKKLAAGLAALLVRLWTATLRLQVSPATRHLFAHENQPTLFAAWHNRLFIAVAMSRTLRPHRSLHNLISASKDGAWLTAFFERLGISAVRGSSSRGGREAAATMVDLLRAGHDTGITPDGPRGPIYEFKPGALIIARRSRSRLVLLGATYSHAWSLRSWDRFLLPHPFSCVHIHAESVAPESLHTEDALKQLETRLRLINAISPQGLDRPRGDSYAII